MPEDYEVDDLSGKDAVFDCTVQEIHEGVDVAVDDEFAKSLGMEDLDTLKVAVASNRQEYNRLTRGVPSVSCSISWPRVTTSMCRRVWPKDEFEQIWRQIEDAKENDQLDEEDKKKSDEELRGSYPNRKPPGPPGLVAVPCGRPTT